MGTPSTTHVPIWELPGRGEPVAGLDARGDPQPSYAAALGLVSAPLPRRFLAALLDIGLFWVLQVPFLVLVVPLLRRLLTDRISWYGFVNHPDFLLAVIVTTATVVVTLALVVGQLVALGRWGLTLGKLAAGLRAVNVRTLARPGFWRVTGRALVVWLPVVTVVGPLVVLASPFLARDGGRGRGWHDRAGHTWVVDVRAGLNPYDEKRMRIARKVATAAPAPRPRTLPSLATPPAGQGDAATAYRPGARTSAGVLGVARPHRPADREVVGLTGFEAPSASQTDTAIHGLPLLGGYPTPAGAPPVTTTTTAAGAPADTHATGGAAAAGGHGTVPPAAPRHVAPASGVSLLLDTGERIPLATAVVIGRSPEPVEGARAMSVADPSVSKTHVLLRPVASGLEVVDQGSTNGTVLVHQGHDRPLTSGEVVLARPGDTVRFGDRAALVLGS